MKFLHEDEEIVFDLGPRGIRVDVEDGSNPAVDGWIRAFKFWVMLSSIALREIRKKSKGNKQLS